MTLLGPGPADVRTAAEALRRGGLVAFPTETVYGLGADASDSDAVAKIFAAKGRPADHPVIVHLGAADALTDWAQDVPDVAWALAERFWPGPLTLILRRGAHVPLAVTGGQDTVGLRVPAHPVALDLLTEFGGGLAAPSANRFGRVSPTTAAHVLSELGTVVDHVVDGGPCTVGLESTILDLTGNRPRLLRPGGLTRADLSEVLGDEPQTPQAGGPRAPGRLESHYAPTTPLQVVPADDVGAVVRACTTSGRTAAVLSLAPPDGEQPGVRWVTMPNGSREYGQVLYARLREADTWRRDLLVVERPPVTPAWEAVHDRLGRAAADRPTT
ncbi:L-threonylcarbamoyladenylate synthase [Cellulomonas bogoriensis]|uniref:Threonylcarbamoyl-AMP synthase n=1 Tax=Cellulomonas bogoriensis 69B4 = DSM 16987 TaxID=1386082 RepID=A0A0A0C0D6_9CELL|nr:L-threonylcarbamoyladenylate synthase [Cellulomonas bogoriensis]KGM13641.1 translation factor Sua5 [Cellulomonas bogoriensis 69B4 = DSM 16987]